MVRFLLSGVKNHRGTRICADTPLLHVCWITDLISALQPESLSRRMVNGSLSPPLDDIVSLQLPD